MTPVGELDSEFEDSGEGKSAEYVALLGRSGLVGPSEGSAFVIFPSDVDDLNKGVLFDPVFASVATLSLASAASDFLLLLVTKCEEDVE